jgi:hypothetical protein
LGSVNGDGGDGDGDGGGDGSDDIDMHSFQNMLFVLTSLPSGKLT